MIVDPAPLHAWVDESAHLERGLYILAAAVAPASDSNLERSRAALASQLLRGQQRLHWRDERKPQRRMSLVESVAGLELASIVIVATQVDTRKQDERARRKCLEVLLDYATFGGVEHLWLESRGAKDAKDREMVAALRSRGALDPSVRVDFARPVDDPMLWIPDVVAGAVGVSRAGDDRYRAVLSAALIEHEFEL